MRLIRPIPSSGVAPAGPALMPGALGAALTAMVTPFRDGQVDTAALAALCARQLRHGTTALVMCGSTGEAPALLPSEQMRVVRVAAEAAAHRAAVIAGCWAPAIEAAAALAGAAVRSGADAVLCAPPAYIRPTQEGVVAHVQAVAHAADRPVLLYDVPARTGIAVADETVARLFERGLIHGIKDATADLSRPVRLRGLCGSGLQQFTGDDATAAAYRAMGGHGCISVTANLAPGLCARLHQAWDAGDLGELARLRDQLAPLNQAMFLEPNPIPVKAALALAGLCGDGLRLPLTRASQGTRERLQALVPSVMALEEDAVGKPRFSLVQ